MPDRIYLLISVLVLYLDGSKKESIHFGGFVGYSISSAKFVGQDSPSGNIILTMYCPPSQLVYGVSYIPCSRVASDFHS